MLSFVIILITVYYLFNRLGWLSNYESQGYQSILWVSFVCLSCSKAIYSWLYNFYLNYIVYVFFWIMDTSIIINRSMLSCASNVILQKDGRWRHFFEDLKFVASPSPPRSFPIYAETVASVLAANFFLLLSIANLNVMIVGFWIS
jgi:hypothetical protein